MDYLNVAIHTLEEHHNYNSTIAIRLLIKIVERIQHLQRYITNNIHILTVLASLYD